MIEVIMFGRGGQGGVTGSQILAEAAIISGKFQDCSSFPSFGAERRGAPVEAYCRISDEKIWTRSQIQQADIAVVLDESIFGQHIINKLKSESTLVMNTPKCPADIYHAYNFGNRKITIVTADIIQICLDLKLLNRENQPIVNTPILGAISCITKKITLEDFNKAIIEHFGKSSKVDINIEAAKIAAEQSQVNSFSKS